MNIELTTDNLRKSCRVCLNQGELNIWEHAISLPNDEISQNSELTALELFRIYENYDRNLLGLNEELKLLCFTCLDELTKSYIFYKKAAHTNTQIQRLYNEAQKIEAEQFIELGIIEEVENEYINESNLDTLQRQDDQQDFDLIDESNSGIIECAIEKEDFDLVEETQTEAEMPHDSYVDQIDYVEEEQHMESSAPKTNIDDLTTPKTDEVEANEIITDLIACDNELKEVPPLEIPTDVFFDDVTLDTMTQTANKRSSGPAQPPHEDGSLVVTQFLPSTAHIVLDTPSAAISTQADEGVGGIENLQFQTPDLSTVDYAAVEVKSSNLQQIIDEEMQLQNTKPTSPKNFDLLDAYGNKEQLQDTANTVYICKFCPQAFSAPSYLIAHVRKSHVCKYCTQAFAKSMDLFVHIRQAHHQHKCAICSKELSSHSNLRGHIKRVHGIRLPAQVALLDYRPPVAKTIEQKPYSSTLDEMDMYF